MKKIVFALFVIVSVLFLGACGKKENNETILADDEVVVNDVLYKLNADDTGYGLKYKIDINFRKTDTGNALNYFGQTEDKSSSNFIIRLFHYTNKNIDYAIKDTTESYDSKEEVEINGVKYVKVHFENYNGANTYLFYYTFGKETYVFCFTANKEEERLERIFLSNVVYE